jgi:LPXTG-motif cell wall-anchored protein
MTRIYASRFRVALSTLIVPVVVLGMAVPSMFASEWNKLTKLTFNQPVEIPGQVLPAGTYWFRLLDSPSSRDIVQVFNADRSKQVALVMAIPDYRTRPTGKTVITFEERATDAPPAVSAWFYPGDNYGQQFVYPKRQAVVIAKRVNHPVLSIPAEQEANTKQPASQNQASANALRGAPLNLEQPSGQETEANNAYQTPPQLEAQNNPPAQPNTSNSANRTLPSTASDVPLIALAGLILIGLGSFVTVLRRRID